MLPELTYGDTVDIAFLRPITWLVSDLYTSSIDYTLYSGPQISSSNSISKWPIPVYSDFVGDSGGVPNEFKARKQTYGIESDYILVDNRQECRIINKHYAR